MPVKDLAAKAALVRPMVEQFAEEMREEGRREILREIAASTDDPRADHDGWLECIFCGEGDERPHTPNCLWLRALQVTKDAR